jgi:hypothetical protein
MGAFQADKRARTAHDRIAYSGWTTSLRTWCERSLRARPTLTWPRGQPSEQDRTQPSACLVARTLPTPVPASCCLPPALPRRSGHQRAPFVDLGPLPADPVDQITVW